MKITKTRSKKVIKGLNPYALILGIFKNKYPKPAYVEMNWVTCENHANCPVKVTKIARF